LDKRSAILDTARDILTALESAGLSAGVIGGIAVVLHRAVRTTKYIDILIECAPDEVVRLLVARGFTLNRERRELNRDDIRVRTFLPAEVGRRVRDWVEIEGIRTVSVIDLIAMKLRSGMANILRAQDLADVIALIRHNDLNSSFTRHLDKSLRPKFRRLVRAIAQGGT
jgi:hypothetical protein